jgi:hypothetical protein
MRYTMWIAIGIVLLLIGGGIVFISDFIIPLLDQTIVTIGDVLVLLGAVISVGTCLSLLSPCGRGSW